MPLTALQFDVQTAWSQTGNSTTAFTPPEQADQENFAAESTFANGLSFWNQLNAQSVTLLPNTSQDIDCYAFTNLCNGAVTATAALGVALYPVGGNVTITPGGSNPLNWFFNGSSTATTAGLIAYNNGVFVNSLPGSDTGTVAISPTSRTLRLTNGNGSATVTTAVCVVEAGNTN